jgi:protein-tyrosine phosphatase
MSFPGSGLQAIYRNSLAEVCRFLTMKHGKSYMIWNLSEHTYDYKSFDNRIMDCPFPDHHAPPMDLLFSCLQTLDSWIRSAEDHIAVLHCIAEGTPITLADGTARRIEDLVACVDGAAPQLLAPEAIADAPVRAGVAKCAAAWCNGQRECVAITLQDGRELVCTPDHRLLTADGIWVEAGKLLVGSTRLAVAGVEAPLDVRAPETEAAFALALGSLRFDMRSEAARARTLALARVLGFVAVQAHGAAAITVEARADGERVLDDMELVSKRRPALVQQQSPRHFDVCVSDNSMCAALASASVAPWLDDAPLAVVREFLGGVAGAAARVDASRGSILLSLAVSVDDGERIVRLLERCGVKTGSGAFRREGSRRDAQLELSDVASFAANVGIRYCSAQQRQLAAACALARARVLDTALDAATFFSDIGASAGADDDDDDSTTVPTFAMRVTDRRDVGVRTVYDVTVPRTESFVANGVAVHNCMGGKGRTGTIIICYLYFSQMKYFPTIEAARQLFARKRSAIEKGIVQPSQIRYVSYFSEILDGTADILPRALTIESLRMQKLPEKVRTAGDRLEIEVYDYTTTASVLPEDKPLWASYWESEEGKYVYDEVADIATVRLDLQMSGDILIKGVIEKGKKYKAIFLLTFNTSFIELSGKKVMRYMRKDLDLAFKDKKMGWEDDFQVDVTVLPAPSYAGAMQQTATWGRMRDSWQTKFPSLVKQRREPLGVSQSAKRAEEIARDSRLAAIAQNRALPTAGSGRGNPIPLGAAAASSTSASTAATTSGISAAAAAANGARAGAASPTPTGASANGGANSLTTSAPGWIAGETMRRQRAGNAPLVGRPTAMSTAPVMQQTEQPSSPNSLRPPVLRRETKSHIKLHVTAFNDEADETEETFEFDVDNDDATLRRGGNANDITEVQWMNFAELNEIESAVMQMQADVDNAFQDLDRDLGAASTAAKSPPPRVLSPGPAAAALPVAAPQRVLSPGPTKSTVQSVDSIIRELGAAVGADDAKPPGRQLAASIDSAPAGYSNQAPGGYVSQSPGGYSVQAPSGYSSQSSYDPRASYAQPAPAASTIPGKYRGPAGEDLSAFVWYRPDVNRQMAEEILRDCPIGSFVVRPSSQPSCLALSHKDEEYGVGHMLLRYWNVAGRKGYSREMETETFDSVVDVLHSLPLRFDDEPTTPSVAVAQPQPARAAVSAVPLPTKAAPIAPKSQLPPVEIEPALPDDDDANGGANQGDMVDMLRFF